MFLFGLFHSLFGSLGIVLCFSLLVEFLQCPMPSNAAVVWEEVLKVIINMGGVCRFEEEKLTYGSPADVF